MYTLPPSADDTLFLNNLAISNAAPSAVEDARVIELLTVVSQERESLQTKISSLDTFQLQLNIIHPARRRIPPELWSTIFKNHMFIDFEAAVPSNHSSLMLTCRSWLDVVLTTPELWSHIHLRFRSRDEGYDGALRSLQRQLRLSSGHPLLVYINSWHDELKSSQWALLALDLVLGQSTSRIQSLVLHVRDCGLHPLMSTMTRILPNLLSLEVWNSHVEERMTLQLWRTFASLFPRMRHLDFCGSSGMWPPESLQRLHSLKTDDICLPTKSLQGGTSSIQQLYLERWVNSNVVDDQEPLPVNETIQLLDMDCRSRGTIGFVKISRLHALESLIIRNCSARAWRKLGPALNTLLEGSKLVNLSFEIQLGKPEEDDEYLWAVFSRSLPSLQSLTIVEYNSEKQDEYGPDLSPFPLKMLHHKYDKPTLPSLENLRYRIHPKRFSAADPWDGDREFVDFLCEVEELVRHRIYVYPLSHREEPDPGPGAVSLLKLLVIEGGYKRLEDFASFERRLREYEKNGLELYFSANISGAYKNW